MKFKKRKNKKKIIFLGCKIYYIYLLYILSGGYDRLQPPLTYKRK